MSFSLFIYDLFRATKFSNEISKLIAKLRGENFISKRFEISIPDFYPEKCNDCPISFDYSTRLFIITNMYFDESQ